MNKIILMGRLTRDIEVRYTNGQNQMAIARYTLAVKRNFKREGEPEADFVNCVAFGKAAEFAERYFRQGTKIIITGRIQTGSYTNREGVKVYTTEVVIEEQEFAESKSASAEHGGGTAQGGGENHGASRSGGSQGGRAQNSGEGKQQSFQTDSNGFMHVPDGAEDDLPFH